MITEEQPKTEDSSVGEHYRWLTEIKLYEKEAEKFEERGKKICRRYKDERDADKENVSRFNILWSNVQTLLPAIYGKPPIANVERRFKDDNVLERVTADILERSVKYFVAQDIFSNTMRQAVLDRLLPGRGVAWVRYVPHFKDGAVQGNKEVKAEGVEVTDDAEVDISEKPADEIDYEEVIPDYVNWMDFGHTVARTWEEVRAVWRRVYLDRKELVERFGEEIGAIVPLDYVPKGLNDEKISQDLKKASIYEIWDKYELKARWLHKDFPRLLDERDDPLGLPDFFPCPRPMLASTANDSVLPIADFIEYQDQAHELDRLTAKINSISRSLKVAGIYDAAAEGIENLLSEGVENKLLPVTQYAALSERGGLANVMNLLPMQEITNTLTELVQMRQVVKGDLYEISGISDVIRGATDPNETAAAQELKGQYANMRLSSQQEEVQRFARDIVRIMANIIAEHFSIETIKNISGIRLFTAKEKAMKQAELQQQAAMAQQQAQPGQQPSQAPEVPDEVQEMLDNPAWEEVEALLRNDAMRCFRIDIETDSTIKSDQDKDRQARIEFLTAVGQFLEQVTQIQQPELFPLFGEMLRFGVRGFKVGRELEGAFELALNKIEKASKQPPPPTPPDPKLIEVQGNLQLKQQEAQMTQAGMQQDAQVAQASMQQEAEKSSAQIDLEHKKLESSMQLEMAKMALEREKMQLEREKMQSTEKMNGEKLYQDKLLKAKDYLVQGHEVGDIMGDEYMTGNSEIAQGIMQLAQAIQQSSEQSQRQLEQNSQILITIAQELSKPKRAEFIRDAQGRAIGAVTGAVQ